MTVIEFRPRTRQPVRPNEILAKVSKDWGLAYPLSFAVEIMLQAEGNALELKRAGFVLHEVLRRVHAGQSLSTCANPPRHLEPATVGHLYGLGVVLVAALADLDASARADQFEAEARIKTVLASLDREILRLEASSP